MRRGLVADYGRLTHVASWISGGGGFLLPPARYAAWVYLAASDARAHAESGCLAFSDPRAGSAMTAMPGLPFGRQFIVRPVPGACAVVPGWLTSSVIPLEPHQHVTVAIASGR